MRLDDGPQREQMQAAARDFTIAIVMALARVVIGGLLASTLVTLVLIPVAYTSVTGLVAKLRSERWLSEDTRVA